MSDIPLQSIFNKARKDKFILVLTLPKVLQKIDSDILSERAQSLIKLDSLQFSIWGSPVPEVTVPDVEQRIWGQAYKVTSQSRPNYNPISVNFTVDHRFSNYWVLWKWLYTLNHPIESGMEDIFANYIAGKPQIDPLQAARDKAYMVGKNLQKGSGNKANLDTPSLMGSGSTKPIHMVDNFLDYQTIVTIYGLDEYNEKVIEFTYTHAFITQLSEIAYNYRDSGDM
jgi:hypothetical protein